MKNRFLSISLLAALVAGVFALPVLAGGIVIDSKEGLATISRETTVDGNAFVAGDSVEVDGTVQGDLFCAGSDLMVRGTVEGDVLCAGNNLTVSGVVKGDVRVAGNVLTINGVVDGAVSAAGSSVTIGKDAKIGTDVVAWGSKVSLDGTVGRDVRGGGGVVAIGGVIGRDVDVSTERVTVASEAKIGRNLTYMSESRPTISEGVVGGTTSQLPLEREGRFGSSGATFSALVLGTLVTIVFTTALTLVIVLLAPRYVRAATAVDWQGFFFAALIGILAFAVFLPLLILSFVSVIGLVVGVFLLVAFILASLLAGPLVAYYIGKWVLEDRTRNMLLAAFVGSLLVGIIAAIPLLGFLAVLIVYFAGLGLVILSFRSQYSGGYTTAETVTSPATIETVAKPPKPVRKTTKK